MACLFIAQSQRKNCAPPPPPAVRRTMHTSSRSVVTPLPGAPAVRSPSALPGDAKRELKEALDHFHVAAQYETEHIASAPASEPLQYTCT